MKKFFFRFRRLLQYISPQMSRHKNALSSFSTLWMEVIFVTMYLTLQPQMLLLMERIHILSFIHKWKILISENWQLLCLDTTRIFLLNVIVWFKIQFLNWNFVNFPLNVSRIGIKAPGSCRNLWHSMCGNASLFFSVFRYPRSSWSLRSIQYIPSGCSFNVVIRIWWWFNADLSVKSSKNTGDYNDFHFHPDQHHFLYFEWIKSRNNLSSFNRC